MAADARPAYPEQLTKHVRTLSQEQEDVFEIYSEWELLETLDRENTEGQCPCGKTGLRFEVHLRNTKTRKVTHVGTECCKWFGEHLQSVSHALCKVMKEGTQVMCKGPSQTRPFLTRFQFATAAATLVTSQEQLKGYFPGNIGVYPVGRKWEIQLKPGQGLYQKGNVYRLWLACSRVDSDLRWRIVGSREE